MRGADHPYNFGEIFNAYLERQIVGGYSEVMKNGCLLWNGDDVGLVMSPLCWVRLLVAEKRPLQITLDSTLQLVAT